METEREFIKRENEKRLNMNYPYIVKATKHICKKCGVKLVHDTFKVAIRLSDGKRLAHLECGCEETTEMSEEKVEYEDVRNI